MQRTVFAKSSFEFKIHARDTKIINEKNSTQQFRFRKIDQGNNSSALRANPCKNRPKSPIRGKAQKIKIALLLQTGRH